MGGRITLIVLNVNASSDEVFAPPVVTIVLLRQRR